MLEPDPDDETPPRSRYRARIRRNPPRRQALDGYVRVWSEEHQGYSRQNWDGHTPDRDEAGVWTLREAYEKTQHYGPEKQIFFERAPAPEAPE
jgi:hypothetical protein